MICKSCGKEIVVANEQSWSVNWWGDGQNAEWTCGACLIKEEPEEREWTHIPISRGRRTRRTTTE